MKKEDDECQSVRSEGNCSTSSSTDRISAVAEAAALKVSLQYQALEAQKRLDLEQRKIDLERTQIEKELRMAEVKLQVIDALEAEEKMKSSDTGDGGAERTTFIVEQIDQGVSSHGATAQHGRSVMGSQVCKDGMMPSSTVSQSHFRCVNSVPHLVPDTQPSPAMPVLSRQTSTGNLHSSTSVATGFKRVSMDHLPPRYQQQEYSNTGQSQRQDPYGLQYTGIEGIMKTLTEQVCLSRLPIPEPGIFSGEPLAYPSWKTAVSTLIDRRGIPQEEKIHYLRKYLGGQAKEAVEGYLLLNTEDSYTEAMDLLESRYGDSFIVANAFRDKLEAGPKIASRDGLALRKLSDFLRQCQLAMKTVPSLQVLNDDRENQKILMKLPEWLTLRWGRIVAEWRERDRRFPPFAEFVSFISKEANIACDPVTSLQSLKNSKPPNAENRSPQDRPRSERNQVTSSHSLLTDRATSSTGTPCVVCDGNHDVESCDTFLSQSIQNRKRIAVQKGLCFGCLHQGHTSKECHQRKICDVCFKLHPSSLHGDSRNLQDGGLQPGNRYGTVKNNRTIEGNALSHASQRGNSCKCSMIVPVWVSHRDSPQKEVLVYAMLDTQSDTTFILDKTCNDLRVKGPDVTLSLSTMTDENRTVHSHRIEGLMVRGYDSSVKIDLPTTYSREVMPANRSHIPSPDTARMWPHLEKIADQLMPPCEADIGLLIGYNCPRALAPRDVIPPKDTEPFGQKTDLGWGIVGVTHSAEVENYDDAIGLSHRVMAHETCCETNVQISFRTSIKEVISPPDVNRMMELDFSERCPNEESLSHDDRRFLQLMKEGIHKTDDGHYEMPLPLVDPEKNLPCNKSLAVRRLKQLAARFAKDQRYKDDYKKFMRNLIDAGYAEPVPNDQLLKERVWYIPHHGVYHPKKPEKIRVVFDCSAKYNGETLNDNLLSGPDLTNNLIGVLFRFREKPVAFNCDIEQMFYQFYVNKENRDMLRFLWWSNEDLKGEPVEFRMKVHLFGAASSPACANFGLKQAANDGESSYGTAAADFVRHDFYVDDGLKSTESVDEALDLIAGSQGICKNAGLRLHKFASNNREVLNAIKPDDRAQDLQNLDLCHDNLPAERVLGVHWCIESDTFGFRIQLQDKPLTRRGVLSTVSSVYDPAGFLAPVLLVGKQILQQLCRENADWDSEIPEDMKAKWEKWRSELLLLETLEIPRCYKPEGFGEATAVEIHHFSDASTLGYGQCSYLRLLSSERVHCTFLMGKARVAPMKHITIPRLELTAAAVLSRVQQIREHTDPSQWRYVSSSENPADEASRGVSIQEFISTSKWIRGPSFLWERDIPQTSLKEEELLLKATDPEVKQANVHVAECSEPCAASVLERLGQFSDWYRAKRAVAVCLRFVAKLKVRVASSKAMNVPHEYEPCSVEDLSSAEKTIIKQVQDEVFEKELSLLKSHTRSVKGSHSEHRALNKASPLYDLDPFLDDCGLLRVGGRLRRSSNPFELKHPVILPKRHHITQLIIRHFHEREQHQGRGITCNAIRANGFWIVGGRSRISEMIFHCIKCRRLRSKPQEQKMADLPSERIEAAPPFTHCGVDYFGPWTVKEGRKQVKRYGVLFTCLASRAIHIETATALTTDSFISALRRFIAIRGPIRLLRCDQGTNFVGAARELREALKELNQGKIRHFLLDSHDCDYFEFKFNVPGASHMGGVWERQIRTVRNVLASMLDRASDQLDDETLRTLLCEVTAIVNSRPLTTDNLSDALFPEPLTPNHLLTMKSKIILPPPGDFIREDLYLRKRWRRVQYLGNEFWNRWRKEYLQNLQIRQKWTQSRREAVVGDIVMVKDCELSRNQWPLARIVETHQDQDGHIRTVKLALADSQLDAKGKRLRTVTYLHRPIQKLVLLLENE